MATLKKKEARTIAIDPDLWKLAERAAKKEGITVSQYVSGAVMWELVTEGNIDALKMLGGGLRELLREKFGSHVGLGAKLVEGGGGG